MEAQLDAGGLVSSSATGLPFGGGSDGTLARSKGADRGAHDLYGVWEKHVQPAATMLEAAGRKVALLEAGRVVSGVTGYTTAKVTSLHTLIYDELTRTRGRDANRRPACLRTRGRAPVVARGRATRDG